MVEDIANKTNITEDRTEEAIDTLSKFTVSCLSALEPYDAHSTLMWAHYANFHMGICIEYNTTDIIDSLKKIPAGKGDDSPLIMLLPVQYEHAPVSKNVYIENTIIDMFYKQSQWSYEHEWRIMLHSMESIVVKPAKIWFGCRCKNETQNVYKYLCEKHSISTESVEDKLFI